MIIYVFHISDTWAPHRMALYRMYILLLLVLIGCDKSTEKQLDTDNNTPVLADGFQSITITDDAGRQQTVEKKPAGIIPLAPNLTELLYAIGAGHQVAGVSIADDYPPQIASLPRYSSYPMDFEALVALKPDFLVATDAINNPKDADQFTSIGLPVMYFSFKTWQDIPRVMRVLGSITGNPASANQVADSLEAQSELLASKLATVAPPRTLFLIGADQLYAFGAGNYIHEAITMAGGESITADLDTVSPILSEEFVLTSKPDVIIGTFGDVEKLLEHHPAFRNVPAILNRRVCTIDASLVLRPGPRLLAGIQEMARCLHPTLFATSAAARTYLVQS